MSDVPEGEGWWQASDGKWYPPTQPTDAPPTTAPPPGPVGGDVPPGPGYWKASDGNWYPPESAPTQPPGYAQPGYPPAGMTPGYPPVGANPANMDPLAKSKMTAGILGILLGGFGVHRFYLGYTNIGIIQIVVTVVTCGIGAIWGVVEGIMILVGSEQFRTDATGRPLKD